MKSYAFTLLGSNSNEVVTDKETHGDENILGNESITICRSQF